MGIGFKPLGNRIVVERIEQKETRTAGGIIIPDTAKEKPTQGTVVAVGPGTRKDDGSYIPMNLRVGDRVLFGKWGGTEVKIGNKEYLLMKEEDVYGIIE